MGWGGQVSLLGMEFNPVYLLVTLLFGLAVYFFFGVIRHFFSRLHEQRAGLEKFHRT